MRTDSKLEPLRSPLLAKAEAQGVRHGFFTRVGGVSQGIYRGLNIGVGSNDDPALVRIRCGRPIRFIRRT